MSPRGGAHWNGAPLNFRKILWGATHISKKIMGYDAFFQYFIHIYFLTEIYPLFWIFLDFYSIPVIFLVSLQNHFRRLHQNVLVFGPNAEKKPILMSMLRLI